MMDCKQRILGPSPLSIPSKSSCHHQNDLYLHNTNADNNNNNGSIVNGSYPDLESYVAEIINDDDGDGAVGHCCNGVIWRQRAEDLLWFASSVFILYYGDLESNFFSLLANDPRVWRTPLNIGLACLLVDSWIILYMVVNEMQAHKTKLGLTTTFVIEATTLIGLLSFTLICIALWPIWNFLTVPMLVTLFMATMVVAPYILPFTKLKLKSESPHALVI